jgi:L-aspartate oxidase
MTMAAGDYGPRLPEPVFRDATVAAPPDAPREMNEVEVRALMWKSVGLFRDRESLQAAVSQLQAQDAMLEDQLTDGRPLNHAEWRRASVVTVASLIANAALRRQESRGGHFRTDFPAHDDLHWKAHITDVMHRS